MARPRREALHESPSRRALVTATVLAAALPLFTTAARGEPPADMETLVVEGDPVPEPEGAETQFATRIDVSRERGRVVDPATVLDQAVGVHVREFGGLGSFATLSLRGSNANQVKILIDGIPLDDPLTGAINVNSIRLDAVERIEVFRGFTPLRFGSPGLGGAVNFVTRPASGDRVEAEIGGGSFGTVRGNLYGSRTLGRGSVAASFGGFSTDGDFRFLDDNGTPFDSSDDETVRRRNNDRRILGGNLRYHGQPVGRATLVASADVTHRDEGVPGIGSFQSTEARFDSLRSRAHVDVSEFGTFSPVLETNWRAFGSHQRSRFRDPLGEVGVGPQDSDDRSLAGGGETRWAWHGFTNHRWSALLRGGIEVFREEDPAALQTVPDARRTTFEGGLEDHASWSILRGLSTTLGVAVLTSERKAQGRERRDDTLASPRFGIRWDPLPAWSVRANVGRAYRVPTFLELFGNTGTLLGNPDLAPEEGWHADLGARWMPLSRARLEVTGFFHETDDLIVFEQNSQRTSIARNVGKARGLGLEAAASLQWGRLDLAANATLQRVVDRGNVPFLRGNDLPGRPRERAFFRAAWTHRRVEPFVELDLTGENFLDRANLVRTPARSLLAVGARIPLRGLAPILDGFECTVEGRNLTDDRVLDIAGYPLPGRSWFASLRWEH